MARVSADVLCIVCAHFAMQKSRVFCKTSQFVSYFAFFLESFSCVIGNSGVFAVDVNRDTTTGNLLPLNLKLYPTREDYSINIMCEDFADRIVANSCKATATPPPAVRLDAGGFGCTIVGTGENTDEVQIEALCQPVAGLIPPARSSKSSKL